MKSFSGILLLCCLLLPTAGGVIWLQVEKALVRREVKHRMMESIPRDQLVRLAYSHRQAEHELAWEHDREFEYLGEMYDVVEKYETTDSLIVYCWPDREESALNRKLRKLHGQVWQNQLHQEKDAGKILVLFPSMFPPAGEQLALFSPLLRLPPVIDAGASHILLNSPPTPPPRL